MQLKSSIQCTTQLKQWVGRQALLSREMNATSKLFLSKMKNTFAGSFNNNCPPSRYHQQKYRVFRRMVQDQTEYREIMNEELS